MREVTIILRIKFVDEVDDNYVYRVFHRIDVDDVLENDDKVVEFDYVVLDKIK